MLPKTVFRPWTSSATRLRDPPHSNPYQNPSPDHPGVTVACVAPSAGSFFVRRSQPHWRTGRRWSTWRRYRRPVASLGLAWWHRSGSADALAFRAMCIGVVYRRIAAYQPLSTPAAPRLLIQSIETHAVRVARIGALCAALQCDVGSRRHHSRRQRQRRSPINTHHHPTCYMRTQTPPLFPETFSTFPTFSTRCATLTPARQRRPQTKHPRSWRWCW